MEFQLRELSKRDADVKFMWMPKVFNLIQIFRAAL